MKKYVQRDFHWDRQIFKIWKRKNKFLFHLQILFSIKELKKIKHIKLCTGEVFLEFQIKYVIK